MIRVAKAGWSLPTEWQDRFPEGDSHLERYARVLDATEINRTFKKMPRDSTFERWAGAVPEDFRFSVKMTRKVTHDLRLVDARDPLERFLNSVRHLGDRLGPVLVQLPPSLEHDEALAEGFLSTLRTLHDGPVALEARHESWFGDDVAEALSEHRVARVAADPPRAEADGEPAGTSELAYFRLHGSPETYRSAYRGDDLDRWLERARRAEQDDREVWLVFDNTAEGEGTADGLEALERLSST